MINYEATIQAVDDLLLKAFGVVAKGLNPLKTADFDVIVARLARSLERVTGAAETEAVRGALHELDIDWKLATPDKINHAIWLARQQLGRVPEAVLEDVDRQLGTAAKPLVSGTRAGMRSKFGLDIPASLSDTDERIIQFARESTTMFVRDAYGRRTDALDGHVRGLVAEGMESGFDAKTIGEKVARTITVGAEARPPSYWQMVAATFAANARTYAQVNAFSEAQIEVYRLDAVMDMMTCEVCRCMDGRIWTTSAAMDHIQRVMALPEPEDIVAASPWLAQGKNGQGQDVIYYKLADGSRKEVAEVLKPAEGLKDKVGSYREIMNSGALQDAGIMGSPFHARCRCILTTK
jgi:hypothetical protein